MLVTVCFQPSATHARRMLLTQTEDELQDNDRHSQLVSISKLVTTYKRSLLAGMRRLPSFQFKSSFVLGLHQRVLNRKCKGTPDAVEFLGVSVNATGFFPLAFPETGTRVGEPKLMGRAFHTAWSANGENVSCLFRNEETEPRVSLLLMRWQ